MTDRFSLRLDGYDFQDFAVRPEDQVLIVTSFCTVIAAYLRGEGKHSATRLFGFLGKPRDTYSIDVGDRLFSAVRKRGEGA